MLTLVRAFGVLLAGIGVLVLLRPVLVDRLIDFMQQGSRLHVAVVLRLVVGVVLLAAASRCRLSGLVVALGVVFLLSGAGGLLVGLDGMREMTEWLRGWPPAAVRAWALLPAAVGLFLLYAASYR
jgi:hypothetical protein